MKAESLKLPDTTDVIIVGAGIAGISAAWLLHHAGLRVVVCEKGAAAGLGAQVIQVGMHVTDG